MRSRTMGYCLSQSLACREIIGPLPCDNLSAFEYIGQRHLTPLQPCKREEVLRHLESCLPDQWRWTARVGLLHGHAASSSILMAYNPHTRFLVSSRILPEHKHRSVM